MSYVIPVGPFHIALEEPLPVPEELHAELRAGEAEAAHIASSRRIVQEIARGDDDRLLVVVGPCSIVGNNANILTEGEVLADYLPEIARLRAARRRCALPRHARVLREAADPPGLEGTHLRSGSRRPRQHPQRIV